MMQALSNHGISVPAIVGWEENASLIGGSFLVMDRISGVSLPMHPSYHVAGLLHELDPATRREAWFGAINTISQINKLPWREDFGFLHNRSEEHTSELQSLMRTSYAVFCLKKKKDTHKYKVIDDKYT